MTTTAVGGWNMSQETEHKSFEQADETREFPNGQAQIVSIGSLPSGHDAWVVGDETVVVVDWYGASNYAKAD
jgi:hypothetical protein